MTIAAAKRLDTAAWPPVMWRTALDASDTTAQEALGITRYDIHPYFGMRGFQYVRFDQSGGMTAGQVASYVANLAITNITSGTTTTITTSGLTADIHANGLLYCLDDNGAAGAAPEGESGVIVSNSATLVTIDTADAFSAAPAANDDFVVIKPWAVDDSADGDFAAGVAGVVMAAQDQYDYGWVQFYGIHPSVDCIAAGTALPAGESLVADAALLTDGAGDAVDLRVGKLLHALSSDTVARLAAVDMYCGAAFKMSNSTV